jgi:hypothetical protein
LKAPSSAISDVAGEYSAVWRPCHLPLVAAPGRRNRREPIAIGATIGAVVTNQIPRPAAQLGSRLVAATDGGNPGNAAIARLI